ncbi:MAG: hypothetical protein WBF70_00295 [Aeromonas molluscorum]
MRVFPSLMLTLTALGLVGCSNTSPTVGASVGMGYGSDYGAAPYPWWYDDYFYYWDRYYPWCCNNDGEFDDLIQHWWQDLDEGKRDDIKNKFKDWHSELGKPDIETLRTDFSDRWNALSPEQKSILRDRQQVLRKINPTGTDRLSLPEATEAARRLNLDGGSLAQPRPASRPVTLPSQPVTRPVTLPSRPVVRPMTRPAHMMNMPVIRRR